MAHCIGKWPNSSKTSGAHIAGCKSVQNIFPLGIGAKFVLNDFAFNFVDGFHMPSYIAALYRSKNL